MERTRARSYVAEARELLDRRLELPAGYRLEWSGQFEAMQRANRTLRVVVPITLAIILLLLYVNFRSLPESLIVMASVPFALVGSVWLLWALDYNLSVAVWVGLIALAGVAAEIAVILLVYTSTRPTTATSARTGSATGPSSSRPSARVPGSGCARSS